MPATTGTTNVIPSGFQDESYYKGINLLTDPGTMRPGELLQADNFYIDGPAPYTLIEGESPYSVRGGSLYTRPGSSGQLLQGNRHTSPLFNALPYLTSSGGTSLLYASGAKLYQYQQGNNYDTELKYTSGGTTHSFNISANAFRSARQGMYAYIIGNSDGTLYRTDLTSANTIAVPALSAPVSGPAVALTNQVIDTLTNASQWSGCPALSWPSSTSVARNAQTIVPSSANFLFTGGSGSPSPYPYGWTDGGDSSGYQANPITGIGNEIYLDPGAGPSWSDWDYPTPTYYTGSTANNFIKNARVWLASTYAHTGVGGKYQYFMYPEDASVTSQTLVQFSDLVIGSSSTSSSTLTSAANPFGAGDNNKVITIFGGSGFIVGNYTITNVSGTTATVNGNVGTASSTGGVGVKNLDAAGNFGNNNYTLLAPPSAIANGVQAGGPYAPVSSNTQFTQVFSFTGLSQDFDYVKWRIYDTGNAGILGVNSPSLQAVDVRLLVSAASSGLLIQANNPVGMGAWCLGGNWIKRDYTNGASTSFTDLAISSGNLNQVTSSAHPFGSGDVGKALVITGGTNWTVGVYSILSVASNVATLSANAATSTSATSGTGASYTVQDYSKYSNIFVGYSAPASTPAGSISWRFGFLQPGQPFSSVQWSNAASYTASNNAFYCDISTVAASIRQTTGYLFLQIISDLPSTINPTNLCTLGPLTSAGNLSVSSAIGGQNWAPVYYLITYINEDGDATLVNIIESDGSPPSAMLQPTVQTATSAITLATSLSDATITHISVYRFGGIFTDGYGRLVATVPIASSFGLGGDTLTRDQQNPYVQWTYNTTSSTGTLIDNTPDSFLQNAATYQLGRQSPPTNAQSIAAYQGRVWLAVGSTIYGSWSVQSGIENGLFFTTIALPTDPYLATKGFTYTISGADNDPIVALVPAPTGGLLILKAYSVWLLTGTDPTNFEIFPISCPTLQTVGAQGIGCVAPLAVAANPLTKDVLFLSSNGIWAYNNGNLSYMSTNLKGVLDAAYINNPATFSLSAMWIYNLKLYIAAPQSTSDSGNTAAWVYDILLGTWSRYLQYAFTSGVSLTAATDTNAVYMLGYDGQLYTQSGWEDSAYPTATTSPITAIMLTRGLGRDGVGTGRYTVTVPARVWVAFTTGESNVPMTITTGALSITKTMSAVSTTNSVTIPTASIDTVSHDVAKSSSGQLLAVQVQITTSTAQSVIQGTALACAEGSVGSRG